VREQGTNCQICIFISKQSHEGNRVTPDGAPHSLDSTQLAASRTWLAHERTLMAWVRTGTSMISFGFTIYKYFQFEARDAGKIHKGLLTPRGFALIMVSIGLISLLMATIQHHLRIRELKDYLEPHPRSMAEIVSVFVSVFGLLVLLAAIFHA
jgi:putative membrane protein